MYNVHPKKIKLYDRPGNDYTRYKGDKWSIRLSDFGFSDKCILRGDIVNLALLAGGDDGWNIESVVTYLKHDFTTVNSPEISKSTAGWTKITDHSKSALT